jgi:hypothetical protein
MRIVASDVPGRAPSSTDRGSPSARIGGLECEFRRHSEWESKKREYPFEFAGDARHIAA